VSGDDGGGPIGDSGTRNCTMDESLYNGLITIATLLSSQYKLQELGITENKICQRYSSLV